MISARKPFPYTCAANTPEEGKKTEETNIKSHQHDSMRSLSTTICNRRVNHFLTRYRRCIHTASRSRFVFHSSQAYQTKLTTTEQKTHSFVYIPHPIHADAGKHCCPSTNQPTRVNYRLTRYKATAV